MARTFSPSRAHSAGSLRVCHTRARTTRSHRHARCLAMVSPQAPVITCRTDGSVPGRHCRLLADLRRAGCGESRTSGVPGRYRRAPALTGRYSGLSPGRAAVSQRPAAVFYGLRHRDRRQASRSLAAADDGRQLCLSAAWFGGGHAGSRCGRMSRRGEPGRAHRLGARSLAGRCRRSPSTSAG